MTMTSPFDFINAISNSKQDLIRESEDPEAEEKAYNSYIVTKGLSFFIDTIFYANEINRFSNIPNKLQFDYLRLNTIRPKKRFAKWSKAESIDDLEAVQKFFGYNIQKAKQALSILSIDQLNMIKEKQETGEK